MNGFRITLLVLLGLAVGALLCIVTIFQHNQEEIYATYQTKVHADERQQQLDEHKARMQLIGPTAEDEAAAAIKAAAAEQAARVNQAEENRVLASAGRKDAARVAEQAKVEANADKPLGLVASFDPTWGFLMVQTVSEEPLPTGTIVAIRRNGTIIREAEIGERDEESGQFSATLRDTQFNKGNGMSITEEKFIPAKGDEVILSPFPSSRDLRSGSDLFPSDASTSTPSATPPAYDEPFEEIIDDAIPEVDAPLTPMP